MILHRSQRVQVFAFRASTARRNPSYGVALRFRVPGGWRHVSAFVRPSPRKPGAYGCLTFEVNTWRTALDTRTRTRLKAFLRVKVGLGGAA